VGKFLSAERSSCLGIALSTKLFAQTEVRSNLWRINEPPFYLNINFLPQRGQTDTILKTSPLLLVGNQLDAQFFLIRLFESSTCFERLCAHPQEDNCMNTTSGIITLKISEWSKITKITRIHRDCIAWSHDVF